MVHGRILNDMTPEWPDRPMVSFVCFFHNIRRCKVELFSLLSAYMWSWWIPPSSGLYLYSLCFFFLFFLFFFCSSCSVSNSSIRNTKPTSLGVLETPRPFCPALKRFFFLRYVPRLPVYVVTESSQKFGCGVVCPVLFEVIAENFFCPYKNNIIYHHLIFFYSCSKRKNSPVRKNWNSFCVFSIPIACCFLWSDIMSESEWGPRYPLPRKARQQTDQLDRNSIPFKRIFSIVRKYQYGTDR